jgi:hypothetical protein
MTPPKLPEIRIRGVSSFHGTGTASAIGEL